MRRFMSRGVLNGNLLGGLRGREGLATSFRVDTRARAPHKREPRNPCPNGDFRGCFTNRFNRFGGVSRAAKGADCKSAGYAFVGSSPTSPTTLRALRALRLGKPAVREGCRAGAQSAKAGDADAPNRFPLLRRQQPDSDVAL